MMELPFVSTNQPCIYFLYLESEIVYIGSTKALYERLGFHLRHPDLKFDKVEYQLVEEAEMLDIEYAAIREHKPKHNKRTGRRGKGLYPQKKRHGTRERRLTEL